MKCIISIGKLNFKFFMIVVATIVVNIVLDFFEIDSILCMGLFYFGNFLNIIYVFFKTDKKTSKNKLKEPHKEIITYIYNNPYDKYLGKKDIIYIIIISLLFLLQDFLIIFLEKINSPENEEVNNEKDYFFDNIKHDNGFIQFLIWFFCSKYFLKLTFYKHQKFSIIGVLITGLIRWIYISLYGEIDFSFKLIMNFFINLCLVIIYAIFYGYIKGLMEYKFFSPYKCCYIIGIINFPIVLIYLIIVSIIPCNDQYFCKILPIYQNSKDKVIFGTRILDIINNNIFLIVIIVVVNILFWGIGSLLINITMDKFSFFHIIITLKISNFILYIFFFFYKLNPKNIIPFFTICFEFFMYLIFLEKIELNICGLNENIRRNIKERAVNDLLNEDNDGNRDSFYNNENENNIIQELSI